jgi:hypothetical protein
LENHQQWLGATSPSWTIDSSIFFSAIFLQKSSALSLMLLHKFAEHGEGLQVLHYEAGQKYEPHFDYFHDDFNTKNGGQRIATLLMYLYVL